MPESLKAGASRSPRASTARGERTRERLLDAAEQLWGERGIEAVSLREIRIAAGQRNSSALQFHFGDRGGLRLALAQRHMPRIAAVQERLYTELITRGRQDDIDALVETMVRPLAEYIQRGPSERAWIKIAAEEISRPGVLVRNFENHSPAITVHLGAAIQAYLARTLSPELATERLFSVLTACQHLCADRARLEDAAPDPAHATGLPFDKWLDNLLAMATAAMTAPAGPVTGTV